MDLAIFSIETGPNSPLHQVNMQSANYRSLQATDWEFNANHIPIEFAPFR